MHHLFFTMHTLQSSGKMNITLMVAILMISLKTHFFGRQHLKGLTTGIILTIYGIMNFKPCPLKIFITSKCSERPRLLKDFASFLYAHKSYGRYVFNYLNASEFWQHEFQHEGGDPTQLISRAFRWESTPEGDSYWQFLNEMWRFELRHKF